MYMSVMYRLEKWIFGQKVRYIGFTETFRTNERYTLEKKKNVISASHENTNTDCSV